MDISRQECGDDIQRLRLLLQERRFGAFSRLLKQEIEQGGHTPETCRLASEYFRLTGNTEGIAQNLVLWASLAPRDPEPLLHLADLLSATGAVEKAFEALTMAEAAGASAMQAGTRRVRICFRAGCYGQAAQAAERVLALCGSASADALLMQALARLGRNLDVAAGRGDLVDFVRALGERSAMLQLHEAGLAICRQGQVKRWAPQKVEQAELEPLLAAIRRCNCTAVVGSANLLHLVLPLALVHERSFYGRRSRVYVVEVDEDLLSLALAALDVRRVLEDPAVTWLTGPSAATQLSHFLSERTDETPPSIVLTANAAVRQAAEEIGARHKERLAHWVQQAAAYYASLDRHHWADVLGHSPSRPPRLLVITTEYSSYMKYASRDVAAAFEALGWSVRLLKEAQPTQLMNESFIAKALAEFRPDLIWQINYTRRSWSGIIPDGVPFICWDQDNMPHMMSRQQGEATGRFDFVAHLGSGVGYVRRFGYPAFQLIPLPTCVDRSLFHPDASPGIECDVCYVSHHGWTVDQRVDQIAANMMPEQREMLRGVIHDYAARLGSLFLQHGNPLRPEQYRQVMLEAVQQRCLSMPGDAFESLVDHCYRVVANAVWRHQAVRWAIEAGASLKLYGQGWRDSSEFGALAAGPVEHGEPLRRAFASSCVALQSVLAGNEHQRLWEAVASGAVVVMRYHPVDEQFTVVRGWLERFEKGLGQPIDRIIPLNGGSRYVEHYSMRAIQDLSPDGILSEEVLECVRRMAQTLSVRDKLAGIYDEVSFRTPDELRSRIRPILDDEKCRARLREELQQALDHHDYRTQIPRLIRHIRERLLT